METGLPVELIKRGKEKFKPSQCDPNPHTDHVCAGSGDARGQRAADVTELRRMRGGQ